MTLQDAQFTLAKVLRPIPDFESLYQGRNATNGVAFFPSDEKGEVVGRDPDAGKPGFDPNLLNYVDVPLGARVLVWIPAVYTQVSDQIFQQPYRYHFRWRLRNVTDYRNRRRPYHVPRQFPGQDDSTLPANPQRLILPGATRTVVINQAEVDGTGASPPPQTSPNTQTEHLRREAITFINDGFDNDYGEPNDILLPGLGGRPAAHQQGILDPGAFGVAPELATLPIFMPFWFDCEGDQLLIDAVRDRDLGDATSTWDFTGPDAAFSNIYGTNVGGTSHARFEGIGIYLFTGVAP